MKASGQGFHPLFEKNYVGQFFHPFFGHFSQKTHFWGGSVINEARAALRGFDPATTKISEPLYVITGIRMDFWNECE